MESTTVDWIKVSVWNSQKFKSGGYNSCDVVKQPRRENYSASMRVYILVSTT